MSGLVLEIGFEDDKANQIHRWPNSTWMFPTPFQQYYPPGEIAFTKRGIEFQHLQNWRQNDDDQDDNELCSIGFNQSVSVGGNLRSHS